MPATALLNRTYCWVTAWDSTQEIVIQFHKGTQAPFEYVWLLFLEKEPN